MRYCVIKRSASDVPVINGLCYTPAQLFEKSRLGIPIASHQVPDDHFIEGTTDNSPVVDIQYRRGIDINDLWNEEQRIKCKAYDATSEAQRLQKISSSLNS